MRKGVLRPLHVVVCALIVLASAAGACADLLTRTAVEGARGLEGVGSCKQCHDDSTNTTTTNVACHKEIARRLDADLGYHRTVKAKLCAECHREHKGKDKNLVEWSPPRDQFNHNLTGWPLEFSTKVKCLIPREQASAG